MAAKKAQAESPKQVRVRMYRTGFGDCFLITLGNGASARHVLIDFGAHARGEIGTMGAIMDDIEQVTGKELLLLVATHQHRDHISGFGQFAARFADFKIGEVWLPWMDNPDDAAAAALNEKQNALYSTLENHLRLGLGAKESDPRFAAALDALSNLTGNELAKSELQRGFGTGAKVRYLRAGDERSSVGALAGFSAGILGPPADRQALGRMNPPADQRFLAAPGDTSAAVRPFSKLEIRPRSCDYKAIVKDGQPVAPDAYLDALHEAAEVPADRLALYLDSNRNNTSLVILFRYKGKALLFPGDAQWGNWQSWIGTARAKQLLGEVDFFKVAHHGSENATPVDVVKALRDAGLFAMVPTQVMPFPTIPRMPLLEQLEKHCSDHVAVRSDFVEIPKAPGAPKPKPKLPKAFESGEVWIDCSL